jgi:amino acid transporter
MIVGLAVAAIALAPHAASAAAVAPASPLALRLASALIPCFYAYGGYQLTMNLGADLKNAKTRFPAAIAGGMLIVIALYLLLNVGYQRALGIGGIARSDLAAAALARTLMGSGGETLISIAVFLSAAGFVNATILQMPRSYYAMAEDGVLPPAFLRVNPRTQIQDAGLPSGLRALPSCSPGGRCSASAAGHSPHRPGSRPLAAPYLRKSRVLRRTPSGPTFRIDTPSRSVCP